MQHCARDDGQHHRAENAQTDGTAPVENEYVSGEHKDRRQKIKAPPDKTAYELSDKAAQDVSISISSGNSALDTRQDRFQPKKSKTMTKRLMDGVKSGIKLGAKALVMAKIVAGSAVGITGVAGTVHVYRHWHKSPDKIQAETEVMKKEVRQKVEGTLSKDPEKPSIIGKVGGKIAEKGTSHGGAVAKWFAEKSKRNPK